MPVARRLPDEREAVEGAAVAAATAAGLLSDADLLAATGRHGTALSLAVLGFEEFVKARTLGAIAAAAARGERPGFTEETLGKIIYSGHRARHSAGVLQHLAAALPNVHGHLMLGMPVSAEDTAQVRELVESLSAANKGKQAGLYSDFDLDSGTWSSSAGITEADYARPHARIGHYVRETQWQLDEFTAVRSTAGVLVLQPVLTPHNRLGELRHPPAHGRLFGC